MEVFLKELETALRGITQRFHGELQAVRSNRPSVQLVENIKVECYGQPVAMNTLGSISIHPPRDIEINVWDKNNVGAVANAIEKAKIGLSVTNNENIVRASLPPLTDERRVEITKLVRKMTEEVRIQVRHRRDEVMKKIKAAQDEKKITEDQGFKAKEQVQKTVDAANEKVEKLLEGKLKELSD